MVRKASGAMASRTPIALFAEARERTVFSGASHYHWRTWIPVSGASYVELEITYADVLEPDTQVPARYTFRASLLGAPRNAELISNPLHDEPIDGELLSRSSAPAQRITLPVPTTES